MLNLKDLKNMDKDHVLEVLGLQTRRSTAGWVLGTLGTFGVGLLVGAGMGLLLAPRPGRELRANLRSKIRRAPGEVAEAVSDAAERIGIEQPRAY